MQKQKFSFNISLILSMAKFFICENSDLWKIKLITSRSWIKMTVEYCRIFLLVFNWLTYFPCWYMTIRLNFALVWLLTAYIYCANYYWNKIRHSLFRKNESTAITVTTKRVSNEESSVSQINYIIIKLYIDNSKRKFYKVTKQLANNLRRTNTELIQQHRFTFKKPTQNQQRMRIHTVWIHQGKHCSHNIHRTYQIRKRFLFGQWGRIRPGSKFVGSTFYKYRFMTGTLLMWALLKRTHIYK